MLMQGSFMSETLERQVGFTAILPLDPYGPEAMRDTPLRTLYLLHDYMGSGPFWLTNYAVGKLSAMNNAAIIMPDGENHFYTDDDLFGYGWGRFVGEELVSYTRRVLPLSEKREDTVIGGFSMGGYGALLNGLRYRETFGKVVALAGALLTDEEADVNGLAPDGHGTDLYRSIFGDPAKVRGSHHDPAALAEQAVKAGGPLPDIFLAVGKEDSLRPVNLRFRDRLDAMGYPSFTFEEGAGGHDFDFAETFLFRGLEKVLH